MSEEMEAMRSEIRFPNLKAPDNINDIINEISSMEKLRRLDPSTLNEYAVAISIYSLYLTHETNKLQAKVDWCESNIKHIVGLHIRSIDGYFNEKDCFIRANNDEATKL